MGPLACFNFAVLLAAVLLFAFVAHQVADGEHLVLEEDFVRLLRTGEPPRPVGPEWGAKVATDITALGSVVVLTILTALVVGFLLLTRRLGAALFLISAAMGAQILNASLKVAYGRERPDPAFRWVEIDTLSFPSGHATGSAVTYLTLGVLLARLTSNNRQKFYLIGSALLLSLLVGLSRVYLGVHYPTDVIAGWALGIAWAQLCWFTARAIGRQRLARKSR